VRRLLVLLTACLLMFATAACGNDSSDSKKKAEVDMGDTIKGLKVSGTFAAAPEIKVDPAVKAAKPVTQVISAGDGDKVQANKKAMFDISIAKGDGTKLYSDVDRGTPTQVDMQENQFFPVLIDGLVGKPQGSRVAIAAKVKDVWGAAGAPQLKLKTSDTVVFVVDVLSVQPSKVISGPEGTKVKAPANAPAVEQTGSKVTGIDFTTAPKKAPKKLKVITLVKGDGPAAKAGRLVTFNYYGAVYGNKKPFDSSFTRGAPVPFGVGVNGLIPAWDKVIPGLKQGSRVLIIAPPKDGYGSRGQSGIPANSTLTFVVDVLGVDS
jgi:FKBP-type peptidyl-prolyl cis-trans isomerase